MLSQHLGSGLGPAIPVLFPGSGSKPTEGSNLGSIKGGHPRMGHPPLSVFRA